MISYSFPERTDSHPDPQTLPFFSSYLGLPDRLAADPARARDAREILRLIHLALLNRGVKADGLLAVSTVMTETEIGLLTGVLRDVLDQFQPAIAAAAPDLMALAGRFG